MLHFRRNWQQSWFTLNLAENNVNKSFADNPDTHSTEISQDIYANVPINVQWINSQIQLQSNRKTSKGFTNKKSVFVIFFSILAYIVQLFG